MTPPGGSIEVQGAYGAVGNTVDPGTIVASGLSADSVHEAAGQAMASGAYGSATKTADQLHQLDISQQRSYWGDLTPTQQGMLKAVGYDVPPDPSVVSDHPSGLWGDFMGVAHDIGHGLMTGVHAVGNVASDLMRTGPVKDVLHVANAGLSFSEHVVRAGEVLSENADVGDATPSQAVGGGVNTKSLTDPRGYEALFSPSAWSRAWNETTNGERTFDPLVERQIQQTTDPTVFKMAKQLASGVPEQEIVQAFPQAQRQAAVQMLTSGKVRTVSQELQNAHLSLGQMVVGERYLTDHPGSGHALSGALDAAFDIAGDPLMQSGKLVDAVKIYRWALDGPRAAAFAGSDTSAFEQLLAHPQVQRYIKYYGDIIEHRGIGALTALNPRLARVANELGASGVTDADSLQEWMRSVAGLRAILTGRAATLAHHTPLMPHLSLTGWARLSAKDAFNNTIDWMADHPKGLPDEALARDDMVHASLPVETALDSAKAIPKTLDELAPVGDTPLQTKLGGTVSRMVIGGPGAAARLFRRLTTITADQPRLALFDPESAVLLRRTLAGFLSKRQVDQAVDLFVNTTDPGQKFAVVKGAVAQMLHAAGVYSGPRGAELGDQMLDAMEGTFHGEAYSPLGIDKMADYNRARSGLTTADPFSGPERSAVLETQLSDGVYMPSFKEVRAAARRDKAYYGLGIINPDTLDKFMGAWKAGVLMRVGFAARVSTDEWLSNAMRNGGFQAIEARARLMLAKGDARREAEAAADEGAALDGMPIEEQRTVHAAQSVAARVPHAILANVRSAKELSAAVLAEGAHGAYRLFGGDMTRQEMYDAARVYVDHVWDDLSPRISSVARAGGGYDMNEDVRWMLGKGDKPVAMRWRRGGNYTETTGNDPLWKSKWHFALDHLGRSKLGRAVLETIHDPHEDQVQAVEDVLRDPDFQPIRAQFARTKRLPDGRLVGRDATEDEAIRSHAEKVVAHTNALVRSSHAQDGPILDDVVNAVLEHRSAPPMEVLDRVENHDLPEGTYGPEMVPILGFHRLVQTGFRGLSKIIDNLSREPITMQAYAASLKDVMPYAERMMGEGVNAEELASDLAKERAYNMIKPYIHNPEVRSQFEVMHRTAMPFLFAQDQFIKRWIRTFADSPEAIRKAQLMMNGLNVSGFTRPDPTTGQPFFYYPASQTVANILANVLTKIGIPASMPISVPFTGEVVNLMPGLSNPLTPSVGPIVAVALKGLASRFPEMEPMNQAVLQEGASESIWEQFLPTTLNRLIIGAVMNGNTNAEFASSMMKAIQMAEATGHGLPANATTQQQQAYLDRVTNWTRILYFTQAALGFFTPATPEADFDPKNFNARLTQLFTELPYNEAIAEFLRENPTATPYTVFASQETGDVPDLPATQAAGAFMQANRGFIDQFPAAAGWFFPRTTGNGTFDPAIYREQITQDMRTDKYPSQFLQDVLMAPSASTYYEALDNEQTALNSAASASAKDTIYANFDAWKAQFLSTNPSFADYLTSGGKAVERADTIRQMRQALASPDAPQNAQVDHLNTLLQGYFNYEQGYASVDGNYSSVATQYRKTIQTNFIAWANNYTAENPDAADFWTVVLQPEMGASGIEAGLG